MKILKILGIILLIVIIIIGVLIIAMPTKYNVERSVIIDAPRNVVFKQVSHFRNFIKWNPWNKFDPNMHYEISGTDGTVGAIYSWSGNDSVGVGTLTNVSITENRINQKLDFISPWETHDIAYYKFEDSPEGLKVTWGLDGNLDRPMNLMGLFMNMDDMVGQNYEDGLLSLKEQVTDYVNDHTKREYFINEIELEPRNFIIKREKVKFNNIQQFYATHFQGIMQMIQMLELPLAGAPSGLYYTWDMENNLADMAAGIPIEGEADIEGYEMIQLSGDALKIEYFGSYSGSAEAHYAIDDFMNENGLTLNEVVVEEYITDPTTEPDTSKWLTNIYYMVK